MRQNLKAYKKVNIESSIAAANPHQIIVMMFDGALQSLSVAKGAIERKDLALKAEQMTKFINIISALRNSLDFDAEPTISQNFDNLYAYCIDRANEASVSLDIEMLSEVNGLLKPLRDAWAEMPEADKQEGLSKLAEKNKVAEGA